MIMAACALLSCFGAWMTWRRNPFYAGRSAVKMLGGILALLGLAVGAIVLTVHLIEGRSAAVQGAAIAAVILLCTWGLILGISAVSTPKAARLDTRLPPGVPLVHVSRERLRPWLRRVLIGLGALLALTLVPGPVRFIAASIAALGGGLALVMLPVAYLAALRTDRAITALQLHPWVHWHYAPDLWQGWCERQAARRADAQAATLSPAGRRRLQLFLAGIAALYAAWLVPGTALLRAGGALVSGLAVFGVARLADDSPRRTRTRQARMLRGAPPDAFFGHDGVFCNGEFCAWRTTDVYLKSAAVETGAPRCLELWFEKILPGGYGGPQVTRVCQQVLIPSDAAVSDLPALQAALGARCPDARIALA